MGDLPNNYMIIPIVLLLIGFALLVKGSDYLVDGASILARKFGISEFIIGVTIIALGTSLPELASATYATFLGNTDLAVGNVIGSNIANIALVLGATSLFGVIRTKTKIVTDDLVLLFGSAIICYIVLLHGTVTAYFGLLLFIIYVAYTYKLIHEYKRKNHKKKRKKKLTTKEIGMVIIGAIGVVLGARIAITGAIDIANIFGISERVIGLTLVALGTSLPELATSINAVLKGKGSMAIGNIAGSNAFNILVVMGIASMIRPLPVNPLLLTIDLPIMILLSLLLIFIWKHDISRFEGLVLLSIYLCYLAILFL